MAHRLSPEAEAELDDIWYYIASESGSMDVADRFIDSLTKRFFLIAMSRYIGRRRDEDLRPVCVVLPSASTLSSTVSTMKMC